MNECTKLVRQPGALYIMAPYALLMDSEQLPLERMVDCDWRQLAENDARRLLPVRIMSYVNLSTIFVCFESSTPLIVALGTTMQAFYGHNTVDCALQ